MVALAEHRKVSFHTPGHKSGKGISTRFRKFVGSKIFAIDLTTLDEVDSLHKPQGVIKDAQTLAALAYGADRSFFLLNGTTGGNHAMILATCNPNDTVLVSRNAHKSVLAGLIFSGAQPIFFDTEIDRNFNIPLNVTYETTVAAIDAHPHAKTLFLTSPNYYGVCADIMRIIAYAHQKGLIVLVDEAHGPHLHFHPDLPRSAMSAGADMAVQSTHKIIGGMTQASMLHAQGTRVDMTTLAAVLRFVQTTSPSYILMASLDLARMQMATEGKKLLDKTIRLAEEARHQINQIPGLFCIGQAHLVRETTRWDLDVTKLTICVSGLGLSGYEASKILNNRYNIQVEMADATHILVIVSIGDRREDLHRLVDSLRQMSKEDSRQVRPLFMEEISLPPVGGIARMTPRLAFFASYQYLPLDQACGAVSSEIVTVYPPGIPLLIPGEVVTSEIVAYIQTMDKWGATIDGLSKNNTEIAVVTTSLQAG